MHFVSFTFGRGLLVRFQSRETVRLVTKESRVEGGERLKSFPPACVAQSSRVPRVHVHAVHVLISQRKYARCKKERGVLFPRRFEKKIT